MTLTAKFSFFPKTTVGLCNEGHFVLCEAGSQFFGGFAKLRKATISSVKSVCPSVSLSVRMARLQLGGFTLNFIIGEFL